tara:strand:- start:109 stop:1077 length:969 start_codon:yes stop_codon:yes gene_type:complete
MIKKLKKNIFNKFKKFSLIFMYYLSFFKYNKFNKLKSNQFNNHSFLISQRQKSGGHLLISLLDGHSKLHVYPLELNIIREKYKNLNWCILKNNLNYEKLLRTKKSVVENSDNQSDHFEFSLFKQKKIFSELNRDNKNNYLNNFFSSFFNSWINYHKEFDKKSIISLAPGSFLFEDYFQTPDMHKYSKLIYILREPLDWAISITKYKPQSYTDIDSALKQYISDLNVVNKINENNKIIFVKFENLIQNTKEELTYLLSMMDLNIEDINLEMTINKNPIYGNSQNIKSKKIEQNVINDNDNKVYSDEIIQLARKKYNFLLEERS